MCAATSRPPRPARGPTRDPRTPPFRLRYVHSPAAGNSAAEASTKADEAATADELPVTLDGSSDEDKPVSGVRLAASPGKPDFFVTLDFALDSLYENDMLDSVPVAPGEQSLHEHAVAAARALAASRAHGLSHKRKQRGSAPPAAVYAVASWRRRVQ